MTQRRKPADAKPPAVPDRLRIAAVQMKFAPTIGANVDRIGELLANAARKRADAVLFPECAVTGYAYDFGRLDARELREALASVAAAAAEHHVNVLIGTPVFYRRKLLNCLVVFDREGRAVHCYAKCQLTESDRAHFTPGNAISLFQLDGIPATAVIHNVVK